MTEDNTKILFPVFLSSEEAFLLLRAIYVNECLYLGLPYAPKEVSDEAHSMYQSMKLKLNKIAPQLSGDVATKSYVDEDKQC